MKHLKTYEILTEYESAKKIDLNKIYFFEIKKFLEYFIYR